MSVVDTQALVKEVMKLNAMSIKDIQTITGSKYKTVESKLYDKGRGFLWHELLLIRNALSLAGGVITREINREAYRPLSKARAWALSHKISDKASYIGEVVQQHTKGRIYLYRGVSLTLPEVAEKSGRSYANCYQRLQKAKSLDAEIDIAPIIDANLQRGRKRNH